MANPAFDIDRLTPTERLDLIEKLWDSFSGEEVPVTEAQREELERRLHALSACFGCGSECPQFSSNPNHVE